jgi:hypothetical protein
MHATHLQTRRPLVALVAAALATLAIVVPGRLAAGDLGSGGASSLGSPAVPAAPSPRAQPDWVAHPLASPLRGLAAYR